jgi:hypothetical protein
VPRSDLRSKVISLNPKNQNNRPGVKFKFVDIVQFTEKFFRIETDLRMFSEKIEGIYWWDIIRHDLFYDIYHRVSGVKSAVAQHRSIKQRVLRYVTRKVLYLNFLAKIKIFRYDIIALRVPRNVDSKGDSYDAILDDILKITNKRVLKINTFPDYYHTKILKLPTKIFKSEIFDRLKLLIKIEFNQDIDIENFVSLRISQFKLSRCQYDRILDFVKPKCVMLVQNGIEKALFDAANKKGIKVIEAQHGMICRQHPGYSYPDQIVSGVGVFLPDVFLVFSNRWIKTTNYPVKRSLVIGNRALSVTRRSSFGNAILVISANIYESSIEEIIRPIAVKLNNVKIIYKLHPNQFERRSEIAKSLNGLNNIKIVSNELSLIDLVALCSAAICVQSTVVYQLLQAGLPIYLIAKQDYKTHADVLGHSNLHVVKNSTDVIKLHSRVKDKKIDHHPDVFFDEFDAECVQEMFVELSL